VGSSSRAFVRGLGSLLLCTTLVPGACSQHSSKQSLEEQPTACRIESIDPVNGTQYVAIAAGSDIFSFALP
jgi:hypothetical protein